YTDGTPWRQYTYDEAAGGNGIGRLTTAITGWFAYRWLQYDAMGRIRDDNVCTPRTCGTNNFEYQYSYDQSGGRTGDNLVNWGAALTTSYNLAGQAVGLASSWDNAWNPPTLAQAAAYNARGEETGETLGFGVVNTRGYDARGRLVSIQSQRGGQTEYSSTMSHAFDGDVSGVNDGVNGNWSYSFDAENRLLAANCSAGCPGGQSGLGLAWSYDRYGNRWTQQVTAGSAPAPGASYAGNNQPAGYSFDAAGNLIADGRCTYTWDGEGRLVGTGGAGCGAAQYK